jgi:YHS domain-containing protein
VIDGRPIFVCCEGCIEKVVQGRDFYFRKVADAMVARRNIRPLNQPVAQNEQAPPRRHIAVSYATPADRPAAQGQGTCPVTNQPLGEHGAPIKIAIDGQPVFVCCQGCVGKVEQNPDRYLSEVARGQQPYPYTTYDVGFYQKPAPNVSDSVGSCCSDNKKGSCCQ